MVSARRSKAYKVCDTSRFFVGKCFQGSGMPGRQAQRQCKLFLQLPQRGAPAALLEHRLKTLVFMAAIHPWTAIGMRAVDIFYTVICTCILYTHLALARPLGKIFFAVKKQDIKKTGRQNTRTMHTWNALCILVKQTPGLRAKMFNYSKGKQA